ncbi:MAG: thioredoxin, partial [Bradymonadia bacterium]
MSAPIAVTQKNYRKEVVPSDVRVILDFWALWCGPCRSIGPILDALAVTYAGQVKVVKVNVDTERELANHFKVQGIPALFAVHNKRIVDQMVGFGGRAPLEALFKGQAAKGQAANGQAAKVAKAAAQKQSVST